MDFSMPAKSFFAAANGFTGFRSYFEEVFNPKDFLRLYVIKGGPGTGKSSLMKKIGAHFTSEGCETEAIFCSSDKNSLDGIIINSKHGRIGILDGTAPHETDAKIPGAVDKIINLGDFWDEDILTQNRQAIINLNSKKKAHYKSAYEYLKLAGDFYAALFSYTKDAYQKDDTQLINDIMFDISHLKSGRNARSYILHSFGKDGYTKLSTFDKIGKKRLSISGTYGSEYIFMHHLQSVAKSRGIPFVRFISPFSNELTEGVLFKETETFVSVGNDFNERKDTTHFLEERIFAENKEKLSYYSKEFNDLITRSKNEFSAASTAHFELEKIYMSSMNFEKNEEITRSLIAEIEKALNY